MRTTLLLLLGVGLATPASAVSLSLFNPGNCGVTDFNYSVGYDAQLGLTAIDIHETWLACETTYIEFRGLELGENYYVRKHVENRTGLNWVGFNHELMDPDGQFEDTVYDSPPADFPTPGGFTCSNDLDGLSFAQDSGLPRTSNFFQGFTVDELKGRDFMEFVDGTIYSLGAGVPNFDVMGFGLRDNGWASVTPNSPFLLAQNALLADEPGPIPEPTTLVLLATGAAAAAVRRIRRKRELTIS